MVRTVETRNGYRLACYPLAGWVVFKPNGDVLINGKFDDVYEKYRLTIATITAIC